MMMLSNRARAQVRAKGWVQARAKGVLQVQAKEWVLVRAKGWVQARLQVRARQARERAWPACEFAYRESYREQQEQRQPPREELAVASAAMPL